DPGVREDRIRAVPPDAVDVGQTNLHTLGPRKIHSSDTCHKSFAFYLLTSTFQLLPSTLSLLVFLIRTNDADDAAAPHHFAFVANPFHRRSHLLLGYLEFTDSTSRQFVPASHTSTV